VLRGVCVPSYAAASRGGCPSTADGKWKEEYPLLSTSNIQHTGGLASSPGSCRIMPAEARTYGNGSSEMRVLLSTLPLSSDAPATISSSRAQAVCTHAPSRCSISVESPIGFIRRGRWLRSRGSPGSLWTSAISHPAQLRARAVAVPHRAHTGWVGELGVPIYRGREVTGFAQDDTGVDVEVPDGQSLRAEYLVGCDGGRSLIRRAAGIEFPGWDPTMICLIAEVELAEEPEWGLRRDDKGIHSLSRTGNGGPVRRCDILSRTHKGGSGWAATC
jgi:hypothetical protein